jgi:imidazole glycerol-phosphate synthase subunit HisH
MIGIVNYGMGNLGSLANMVERVGGEAAMATSARDVERAGKLILPGVGSFDNAVARIRELGLWEAIDRKARAGAAPVLCVCLGAQLATESSEEGTLAGFGWFAATTRRFEFPGTGRKVPHMGWNDVAVAKDSPLVRDLPQDPAFYFVHSYYMEPRDESDILMRTDYGISFASGLERNNIFALQFHPEKSHKYGMAIIRNFVELKDASN